VAALSWNTPHGTKRLVLKDQARVGRSPVNEVALPFAGVSTFHARVFREGERWFVEDLGSKNGTFVNEEPQSRCELHDGDVIGIADYDLVFRLEEPEEAEVAEETETRTLLWKKGMTDAPIPTEVHRRTTEPGPADPSALLTSDGAISPVTSVDADLYTTSVLPGVSEDPVQLARRLKASYEISRAAAETLDVQELLARVLEALFEIFEGADRAFIVLTDPATGEVSTAASRHRADAKVPTSGISMTALRRAMEERQALLCRDAATDERFARAQSIMGLGIRSMMVAPLVFREEVLGAVHVDSLRGAREFTQADLELLSIAAGQVAGCLANARLHTRLVASERMAAVGQALAGLSHCIKNILQGMQGGAFILEKGLDRDNLERVRQGWEMVRRNTGFMEELVYDLLTYSKERRPEYSATDINALCGDVVEMCRQRAASRNVALALAPAEGLGPVELDPKGIRRCLMNLVMNGIDACESGGAVTVKVLGPDPQGFVRLVVADTGCGMSKETLDKLFTEFFSTKSSKGTGLGLPVTKKIIEEHGGRLEVESEVGIGSTFTIYLPASRAER